MIVIPVEVQQIDGEFSVHSVKFYLGERVTAKLEVDVFVLEAVITRSDTPFVLSAFVLCHGVYVYQAEHVDLTDAIKGCAKAMEKALAIRL